MTRVYMLIGVLLLSACENDARNLSRLQAERAEACLPILVEDSVESAREIVSARINAGSAAYGGNMSLLDADLEFVKGEVAAMQSDLERIENDSAGWVAGEKKKADQRIQCQLASRQLTKFMNGN